MTNEKAKLIRNARRNLGKAEQKYFKSGDSDLIGEIIIMQSALTDAYRRNGK